MKTLKSVIVIILILSAAASSQQNYFSSTLRSIITKNSLTPQVLLFDTYGFNNSAWGLANFSFLEKGWGEALIGLTCNPVKTFGATLYFGIETADWWIAAGDISINWKKFSWYNYCEASRGYDCWRSILSLAVVDDFKFRVESYSSFESKTVKIGPGILWSIAKTPLAVMPTVLYNSAVRKAYLELDICSSF